MPDSLRILVIDDDPVMRELLDAVLGHAGHSVETAESGEDALEWLRRDDLPLDVVLTDLQMPGLAGQALTRRLREVMAPSTLLVGMSGSSLEVPGADVLDFFLLKPFTPAQFEEGLRAAKKRQARGVHPAHRKSGPKPEGKSAQVLDEGIFRKLASTLPAAQLGEIYAMMLSDISSRVANMVSRAAAGDLAAVRRDAHAIKGSCGMLGASELYLLASTTEGGTDAGSMPLADFAPACERLKRMLDERLAS